MLAIVLLCLSRVPAYAQIAFAMNARRAFSLMCGLPHTTENRPFTLLGDELEMRRSMRFFQSIPAGHQHERTFQRRGRGTSTGRLESGPHQRRRESTRIDLRCRV